MGLWTLQRGFENPHVFFAVFRKAWAAPSWPSTLAPQASMRDLIERLGYLSILQKSHDSHRVGEQIEEGPAPRLGRKPTGAPSAMLWWKNWKKQWNFQISSCHFSIEVFWSTLWNFFAPLARLSPLRQVHHRMRSHEPETFLEIEILPDATG